MTEDTLYPIYHVHASWTMDAEEGAERKERDADLPAGRTHNSTGFYRMLKEPDVDLARREADEWWQDYEKKGKNPGQVVIVVKFVRNEAWCGGWFKHWTFDVRQSDEEALANFERFVRRMEDLNRREGRLEPYKDGTGSYWVYPYCLMGAQDRHRWCSWPDGKGILGFGEGSPGPAPCRCDRCKAHGVIVIDH